MVDIEYDLKNVTLRDSKNPFVRFIDLLPVQKLQDRLPEATYMPLVHATRLGRELGMTSLYLKNETALPTRTTKDRMAAIALAYLRERGVRSFTASSTGNSSTSFAYGMRAHPDMHLFLFTAERFVPRVQHADHHQVTHIGMRDATFVEAARYADVYARKHGLTSENGFFNPGRREGLKLAFLEACNQLAQPIDWYVQAVSSAMGVYGAYKGARELHAIKHISQLPRLLCVQQESCAPMVHAFSEGSETIQSKHVVARPTGIADAILRGDPTRAYPRIRRIVLESRGDLTAVSEAEIRAARKSVQVHEGISPCFSASTAIAGLIKSVAAGVVDRDATIVINLTGGDRPDAQTSSPVHWIEGTEDGWNAPPPATLMTDIALAD
jgi:threonine synthase